jgi:hypothetical protein
MCPECLAAAAQAIAGFTPAGAIVVMAAAALRRQLTTRATGESKEGDDDASNRHAR